MAVRLAQPLDDAPQVLAVPPFEEALALAVELAGIEEDLALALDLEPIDLPPALDSAGDHAALRSLGPLYLASELESARLVPAAEMLSGLFMSGGLSAQLDDADITRLTAFWRERHRRFSTEEREAFFARVFGRPAAARLAVADALNDEFELLFAGLAEAVFMLDAPVTSRSPAAGILLQRAAGAVVENLLGRRRGVPAAAAAELVAAINGALAIFKSPAVQAALMARGVWDAVRAVSERYLREDADVRVHVERGRAGVIVLAWLADAAPGLGSTGALAAPDGHVIASAGAWLQTTLALLED